MRITSIRASIAAAAEEGASQFQGVEEIVVTAAKRGEQGIQDIPMSVAALDGNSLDFRVYAPLH